MLPPRPRLRRTPPIFTAPSAPFHPEKGQNPDAQPGQDPTSVPRPVNPRPASPCSSPTVSLDLLAPSYSFSSSTMSPDVLGPVLSRSPSASSAVSIDVLDNHEIFEDSTHPLPTCWPTQPVTAMAHSTMSPLLLLSLAGDIEPNPGPGPGALCRPLTVVSPIL